MDLLINSFCLWCCRFNSAIFWYKDCDIFILDAASSEKLGADEIAEDTPPEAWDTSPEFGTDISEASLSFIEDEENKPDDTGEISTNEGDATVKESGESGVATEE